MKDFEYESAPFIPSATLERFLIDWGYALCDAVRKSTNQVELSALRRVCTEFSVFASAYSESIAGFREDLGVSLGEAIDLKISSIDNPQRKSEWQVYLDDTLERLAALATTSDPAKL